MFPSCLPTMGGARRQQLPHGREPVVLNVYDMCFTHRCVNGVLDMSKIEVLCGTCIHSHCSNSTEVVPSSTFPFLRRWEDSTKKYWVNSYTANLGLGVFHSGVEVHGVEYVYGGHPFSFTGIFQIPPRDPTELGDQFRFRQSLNIGWTDFTAEEVRLAVVELGKQFKGDRYHLMNNNCNHFSGALCQLLCGTDIPPWVNRLAYFSSCVPFLQRCLPREWLTPVALQQSLAAHGNSEDSADSPQH